MHFANFLTSFCPFQSFSEGKSSRDPVNFTFKAVLMEELSQFPKEAVDGMLLSLKENAECCNLDKLMEVCLIFALGDSYVNDIIFLKLFSM